jgi:hypothetical protein
MRVAPAVRRHSRCSPRVPVSFVDDAGAGNAQTSASPMRCGRRADIRAKTATERD